MFTFEKKRNFVPYSIIAARKRAFLRTDFPEEGTCLSICILI